MTDTSNPHERAAKTETASAEPSGTAAALEAQSRMCCAVGDLSCVVPVIATPQDLPGRRKEDDAPKASEADEVAAAGQQIGSRDRSA